MPLGRPKGSKNKPKSDQKQTGARQKLPSYAVIAESAPGARCVRRTKGEIKRRLLCSRNWWAQIEPEKIGASKGWPSERSIWRAIQALRLDPACGIEFCVYWRHGGRSKRSRKLCKGRWVLIAALSHRLRFDRMPLFLTRKGGMTRHTRQHHRLAVASWMDLEKKKSESAKETPPSTPSGVSTDSADKDNSPSGRETTGPPSPSSKGNPLRPTSIVKNAWKGKLQRMTLWLVSELNRVQLRSGVKVRWHSWHAYTFVRESLHKGYDRAVIVKAWIKACEMSYMDKADGLLRIEPALLLSHARRILSEHDSLSDSARISLLYRHRNFYPDRYQRKPKEPIVTPAPKGFSSIVIPSKTNLQNWMDGARKGIEIAHYKTVTDEQLRKLNEQEDKRRFLMSQPSEREFWSPKLSKNYHDIPKPKDWEKKTKMEQEEIKNRRMASGLAAQIKDTDLTLKDVKNKPNPVPISDPKVRMAIESNRNRQLAIQLLAAEERKRKWTMKKSKTTAVKSKKSSKG